METVSDVLAEIQSFAGEQGTCNATTALDYLNKARRLLWNKTDFANTMDYFSVWCEDRYFYLPSAYKQIRLAWLGDVPASLGDEWYVSIPQVGLPRNGINANYIYDGTSNRNLSQVGGHFVTFTNYTESPYQIAVQAENIQDEGVKVTVFGRDRYGTKRKEDLTLVSGPDLTESKNAYTDVLAIIKPLTKGRVRLYAVDKLNNNRKLLAIYQPYDKNPAFRKYFIQAPCISRCVSIYGKKEWYPFIDTTELVEFPTEALKFAVTALVAQKARDNQAYQENLSLAVAEVNRETADNEIPTSSPLRLYHFEHPPSLI